MASEEYIESIKEYLKQWDNTFDDKFFRSSLGEASLIRLKDSLDSIRNKLNVVFDNKNEISRELLQRIDTKTEKLFLYASTVKRLDDSEFLRDKDAISKTIDEFYDGALEWWPQVAAISIYLDENNEYQQFIKSAAEELQKKAEKSEEDADSIEGLKQKLEFELANFETRFKDLLTSGEFLAQQDIFKVESADHSKKARNWFFGIIGSIILVICVLFYIVKSFCFTLDCLQNQDLFIFNSLCENCGNQILWFEIIKSILFRILLISISVYVLAFTIKNYNSHMHNKTVNAHKKNSFAAAMSLLNRAETSEGKDRLISLAAQSIFTHIKTGYLSKEEVIANQLLMDKIIEKLK